VVAGPDPPATKTAALPGTHPGPEAVQGRGTGAAAGHPSDVLIEDTVRAVFGLESQIITDPTSGRPLMLPIGRDRRTAPSLVGTVAP
jgi:hypothetical protein